MKLADTKIAIEGGADEIDMVIDRGAFLRPLRDRFRPDRRYQAGAGDARLKVILETGELATYDNVRRASWLRCSRARTSSRPRPARYRRPRRCPSST